MASITTNGVYSDTAHITNIFSATCDISSTSNNNNNSNNSNNNNNNNSIRVHSDVYKMNKHTSNSQEERRKLKLANQKKERSRVFDLARDFENIENFKEEEIKKPYENQLMYSEWFEERPTDLEWAWRVVVCPLGKRSFVIAHRGVTRVYSRSGILVNTFQSELPGGNSASRKNYTLLDCIYSAPMRTYYMLDVMVWNSHPVYDCDTEFRFYWLSIKSAESNIGEASKLNHYKFSLLDNFPCQLATLQAIIASPVDYAVDGLLFYSLSTHYVPGTTPLTLWLTADMLHDKLGILPTKEFLESRFPEQSEEMMDNFENKHINEFQPNRKNKSKKKQKSKQQKMDI